VGWVSRDHEEEVAALLAACTAMCGVQRLKAACEEGACACERSNGGRLWASRCSARLLGTHKTMKRVSCSHE
jgi:hypothetical protein